MERIDAPGVLIDKPGAQIAVDHLPTLPVRTVEVFLVPAPAGAVLLAQQIVMPPVRNLVRYQGFDAGVEIISSASDGTLAGSNECDLIELGPFNVDGRLGGNVSATGSVILNRWECVTSS